MYLQLSRLAAGFSLAGLLLLAACNGPEKPATAVKTETPPAETMVVSSATPAAQITQNAASNEAYPQPGAYPAPTLANSGQISSGSSAYPYPGPAVQIPTLPATRVYPAPGEETQVQPLASPTPYPAPETSAPSTAPPSAITPTPIPQTSPPTSVVPTASPTPTPTEAEIDPDFHPTDPSTVRLTSGRVQLVEFFAYYYTECRAMAPVVHALEAEYQNRMNFIYLDIDNPATSELKKALGYRYLPDTPQFFLLDASGKILKTWLGTVTTDEFRSNFDAALK